MYSYFKVTLQGGQQTIFPIAFWKDRMREMESSIDPDLVQAGELITLED